MKGVDGDLPVAVIGGGPTGVDAALALAARGVPWVLLESGGEIGAGIREWGHVPMFTPWSMNISPRMAAAMRGARIPSPDPDACPTGDEFVDACLAPLGRTAALAAGVTTGARVRHIGREGLSKDHEIGTGARAGHPFRLIVDRGGREETLRARSVVDCSGGRALPNSLGDGGVPAPGERSLGERVLRRIPDADADARAFSGARVLLAGAGHSAQTAATRLGPLLARTGGALIWIVRAARPDWGAVADDPLPARASLTEAAQRLSRDAAGVRMVTGAVVESLDAAGEPVTVNLRMADGAAETVVVDRVVSLTGAVGDHGIYRQLQVHECYATAGPMALAATLLDGPADCLAQPEPGADALCHPEPAFFIAGAKSYGRNSRFLLGAGYRQIDEIVGMIAA